jgi:hypothetical protein
MIKKELIGLIACPKCKGLVTHNKEQDIIICETCRISYEIRDDIPIMLIDEAKPLPMEME